MLKLFLIQIVVLFLVCVGLDLIRLLITKVRGKTFKLRLVDSIPILALYFIHQLTIGWRGYSWDPALVMVWALLGFLIAFSRIHQRRLGYLSFNLTFWRVGDLYLLTAWLLIGILKSV